MGRRHMIFAIYIYRYCHMPWSVANYMGSTATWAVATAIGQAARVGLLLYTPISSLT